jgi:hypothetical protein
MSETAFTPASGVNQAQPDSSMAHVKSTQPPHHDRRHKVSATVDRFV